MAAFGSYRKIKTRSEPTTFQLIRLLLVVSGLLLILDLSTYITEMRTAARQVAEALQIIEPEPTITLPQPRPTEPTMTPASIPSYQVPQLTVRNPVVPIADETYISYIKDGEVWLSSRDGQEQQITLSGGAIGLHEWGADNTILYVTFRQLLEDTYAEFEVNHGLVEINLATGIKKTIIEPVQDPRYFYHLCEGLIHYPSITVLNKSPDNTKLAVSKSGLHIYDFASEKLEAIHELPNNFHLVEEEKGLLSFLVKPAYAACVTDPRYSDLTWSPNSTKVIARLRKWEGFEMHLISLNSEGTKADFQRLSEEIHYQDNPYLFDFYGNYLFLGAHHRQDQSAEYFITDLEMSSRRLLWQNTEDSALFPLKTVGASVYAYTSMYNSEGYEKASVYVFDPTTQDLSLVSQLDISDESGGLSDVRIATSEHVVDLVVLEYTKDAANILQLIPLYDPNDSVIIEHAHDPKFYF